jgi:glycosyltransferase involved in cell wall biosynthesis
MSIEAADIGVVIPAYKAEAFIARAIASVQEQPYARPEVIVVVDGVYDRTTEAVGRFPCVKVLVNETNRGAPATRNRGLAAVTAPFVLFLDADDYIEAPLLSSLLTAAGRSGLDIAFGAAFSEWTNSRRRAIVGPSSYCPM